MQLCQLSPEELYRELSSRPAGLSQEEVTSRLEQYGPNDIVETRKTPLVLRFLANFYHTFALLLWAAGALAFVASMPELGWAIIAVIVINALFSFWQEFQAEKAVEALKKILPARARVIRDGDLVDTLAEDLVPGDIIALQEGDNISADARLLEESELRVNTATLTGESEPVRKMAGQVSGEGLTASEIPNLVLTGTSVAFGSGKAIVFSTGMNTEFGKIASLTQKVEVELSPLQKEVNRVALIIAVVALVMGAGLFGVAALFTPLSFAAAAIFAIGMLVANVPEGLLPTVTLSLAMAVKRMARKNALVKRLSGVETLGSTTVICTDKTGTLTQNEMTVRSLWANGKLVEVTGVGYEPAGDFLINQGELGEKDRVCIDLLMKVSALCNNARLAEPDSAGERWTIVGDPTEASLLVAAKKWGYDVTAEIHENPRMYELPFESRRKRMSVIHADGMTQEYPEAAVDASGTGGERQMVAYIKGAPKEVLSLCSGVLLDGKVHSLDDESKAEIILRNDDLARAGLRVLAMAFRTVPRNIEIKPEPVEQDMVFVGLMAMMDPPRAEVAEAITHCGAAGIKVIMITGDYGLTAESIARRIGLLGPPPALIVNGSELENMPDEQLAEVVEDSQILFARVSPEHKMRIAAALRKKGEIVAMTGDGVNDAPALKTADIGAAMGISGPDLAKAPTTVLHTDDNTAPSDRAVTRGPSLTDK